MSHIAPRPPQRPAHRRTPSNPQTPDKRAELVGKLESCIGEILEATKVFKSPQQQSAHHNANQMFQQRVLASRRQMGNMSDQDWLGTMMQCLNESMRTQQSSFVRNTTLDVALKTFASGIFEALGPAYFQEPFDKYMGAPRPKISNNVAAGYHATANFGISSPPSEMALDQNPMQRSNPQHLPSSATHAASFPSAHQQHVQRPAHGINPGTVQWPQHEIHGIPIIQRPPPAARQPGRPPKRQSPVEASNTPARKRPNTCEALRQAAGAMRPPTPALSRPPTPALSRPRRSSTQKPRLCIDFWDVQQERDAQRRQAILGYGGKWYVFQCHQHEDVLFFKTAEGARHHMMTRHALPDQHIDFLDIIQELGVEVMNCDAARAEKNNFETVNMWNQVGSNSGPQQGAGIRPKVQVHVPMSIRTHIPTATSGYSPTMRSEERSVPTTRPDSSSAILLSDVEASEDTPADQMALTIKQETPEKELTFPSARKNLDESASTPIRPSHSSQATGWMAEGLGRSQTMPAPTANGGKTSSEGVNGFSKEHERPQSTTSVEKVFAASGDLEMSTTAATETPASAEQIPDLTPDSPESSELSEAPSLTEFESFESRSAGNNDPKIANVELEEGEIDESCIRVASCSPVLSGKTLASPESSKKQKRTISAAGSAPSGPSEQRKTLPATPKSSQKKRKERQPFRSPAQETGPSAHDQFKTKACRKCPERFYFRAQLATHMNREHPEVIIVE